MKGQSKCKAFSTVMIYCSSYGQLVMSCELLSLVQNVKYPIIPSLLKSLASLECSVPRSLSVYSPVSPEGRASSISRKYYSTRPPVIKLVIYDLMSLRSV